MAKIAYAARPVDQAQALMGHPESREVCERIDSDLQMMGYHVYRPAEAWRVSDLAEQDRQVELVNRIALEGADLLVAYLPAGVPTVGVPMEVEHMVEIGRPVIVVTDIEVSYALDRSGIHRIESVLDGGLADAIAHLEATHAWFSGEPIGGRGGSRPQGTLKLVVRDGHDLPARAYSDDAGLDLTTVRDCVIHPGQFVDIHTQVDQVQLPDGYWGMITGRSSTLRRHKLHVPMAVIDPGWRGPLFIGCWNLGSEPVKVQPGARLGQLILMPNNPAQVLAVDAVDEHSRGLAGFGSTG